MQKLHFSTEINAPVSKVWDTMLGKETYTEWTSAFSKDSYYDGSWDEGSSIKFIGPDPQTGELGGMVSKIKENRKHEFISIEHIGFLVNGKEIYDTPEVKEWAGAHENYTFKDLGDGRTKLIVDLDVVESMADEMKDMWDKGFVKLKELSEK